MDTKRKEFVQSYDLKNEFINIYQEIITRKHVKKDIEKNILKHLKNRDKINYLDIGCGMGDRTLVFKNFLQKLTQNIKVYGLDLNKKNLEKAAKLGIETISLDIEREKIPCTADIITCFEVIEHIYDTDGFIQNINKSLTMNGILLISTPNVVSWKNRAAILLGIPPLTLEVSLREYYGLKFFKKFFRKYRPAGHIRGFTPLSLGELLSDNGLKIESTWGLENWRVTKIFDFFPGLATNFLVVARRVK